MQTSGLLCGEHATKATTANFQHSSLVCSSGTVPVLCDKTPWLWDLVMNEAPTASRNPSARVNHEMGAGLGQ